MVCIACWIGRGHRQRGPLVHRLEGATGDQYSDSNEREGSPAPRFVPTHSVQASVAFHVVAPPADSGAAVPDEAGGAARFGLNTFSVITRKNIGIRNGARNVALNIPPITPLPTAFSLPEPAPLAIARGSTPRTNASDVIRIGRRRKCAASMAASIADFPCASRSRANSTIRIAFVDDKTIVVSRPTWKKTSFSTCRAEAMARAPRTPSGTTMLTEIGTVQLSYSAARLKKTTRIESPYRKGACDPD